jgi:hypothetical protein
MATHLEDELRTAAQTLAAAARAVGFDPRFPQAGAEPSPGAPPAQDGDDAEPSAPVDPSFGAAPAVPAAGVFDFEAPESVSRAA